jgi:hypothetical protein
MSNTTSATPGSILSLVLAPGLITLAVTILRLIGELRHWSPVLFSTAAGGGAAIVGIVWLVPIFGIYFALKLTAAGQAPSSPLKALGVAALGLLVMAGGLFLVATSHFADSLKALGGILVIAAAAAIQFPVWPRLVKTLLAYGYFARIPVVIIMYFAIRGNWGTHYDGPPPNFPEMGFWAKYIYIGVLPQLVMWVAFTVIIGLLFGSVAVAIARRGRITAQTSWQKLE